MKMLYGETEKCSSGTSIAGQVVMDGDEVMLIDPSLCVASAVVECLQNDR